MRKHDARTLDHATLEALRERAVQRVQEGESPEVVVRVFGIGRTPFYRWLAEYRRGGWGALKAKPLFGRPPKLEVYNPEEPVTIEVRVCAVDPRDGGQAHQGQVRRKIERQFGGASAGATRHHLPEAIAPCDRAR